MTRILTEDVEAIKLEAPRSAADVIHGWRVRAEAQQVSEPDTSVPVGGDTRMDAPRCAG